MATDGGHQFLLSAKINLRNVRSRVIRQTGARFFAVVTLSSQLFLFENNHCG